MASKRLAVWGLRPLVVGYLFFLVAWPVWMVGQERLRRRLHRLSGRPLRPVHLDALELTLWIAAASVAINTVFGVGISLLIVRYRFPGKRVLNALLDLPLSVSPIVVGLALILVYGGRAGWFGPTLESWGFKVIYDFRA